MRRKAISPFEAIFVANNFLVENVKNYDEFSMVDAIYTDEVYVISYKAKDLYARDVMIDLTFDFNRKTISASVFLTKDDLAKYQ